MKKNNFIKNLLDKLNIPCNSILVLHVKLKDIKEKTSLNYNDITKHILYELDKKYEPKAILTPTFTYSFTKSGIFHRLFSKSETGRFSEEVRLNFAEYRTANPIFSFADVRGFFKNRALDNTKAFGKNTIFDYLDSDNNYNINIGLDKLISSQLHHIEKFNQVNYRFNKIFNGYIYLDQKEYKKVEFNYFVRDLDEDPRWNRSKIKKELISKGKLYVKKHRNIEVNHIDSKSLSLILSEQIKNNDRWLLK